MDSYGLAKLLEILICKGYYHNGKIPAKTTLLTFCPGYTQTNLSGNHSNAPLASANVVTASLATQE